MGLLWFLWVIVGLVDAFVYEVSLSFRDVDVSDAAQGGLWGGVVSLFLFVFWRPFPCAET